MAIPATATTATATISSPRPRFDRAGVAAIVGQVRPQCLQKRLRRPADRLRAKGHVYPARAYPSQRPCAPGLDGGRRWRRRPSRRSDTVAIRGRSCSRRVVRRLRAGGSFAQDSGMPQTRSALGAVTALFAVALTLTAFAARRRLLHVRSAGLSSARLREASTCSTAMSRSSGSPAPWRPSPGAGRSGISKPSACRTWRRAADDGAIALSHLLDDQTRVRRSP